MLMFGLPLAVVAVWLALTWEPVVRRPPEEHDSSEAAALDPAPAAQQPEAAQEPAVEPPPRPSAPPASQTETALEPAAEPAEVKSSMRLELIEDQPIDMDHLPPPRSSGPVAQLQHDFEGAARDSSSGALESTIEGAFETPEVPAGLLDSVVCHGAVCRVRTRWTPQRAGGFMFAITALGTMHAGEEQTSLMFERNYGIGEASERNTNGERYLDVYVRKHVAEPD